MFTWICPKCGSEVPPSYSECPNCAAKGQAAPPAEGASAPRAERPAPASAAPRPRRSGMPGWALSLIVAVVLVGVGGGLFYYTRAQRAAESVEAQPEAAITPESPTAAAPAPAAPPSDLTLKNLEITGLRLIEDKQKAQLQFVVVNHSAADLGELSLKVDLKAGADAKVPLATFAIKTTLGPYEAKDLKTPISTKLRVYELPDWQFLRAEIQGQGQ
jgi:hypothetical protein